MFRRMPPPPLTFEEFEKRRNTGARTLFELDPKLAEWSAEIDKQTRIEIIGIISAVVVGIALPFIVIWIHGW